MSKRSGNQCLEQYVILGAGYDSRQYRLNLPPTLKMFVIDQMQEQKKNKLSFLKNVKISHKFTRVSLDLYLQSLAAEIIGAGLYKNKSAIITLEGLYQYIYKAALKEISSLMAKENTIFYMTYTDDKLNNNQSTCFGEFHAHPRRKSNLKKKLSAKSREP